MLYIYKPVKYYPHENGVYSRAYQLGLLCRYSYSDCLYIDCINMEQKSYLEKNYVEAKKTYETFHKFNEKDIDLKKFPFKQDNLPYYRLKNSSINVIVTCVNEEMHLCLDKDDLSMSKKNISKNF